MVEDQLGLEPLLVETKLSISARSSFQLRKRKSRAKKHGRHQPSYIVLRLCEDMCFNRPILDLNRDFRL